MAALGNAPKQKIGRKASRCEDHFRRGPGRTGAEVVLGHAGTNSSTPCGTLVPCD